MQPLPATRSGLCFWTTGTPEKETTSRPFPGCSGSAGVPPLPESPTPSPARPHSDARPCTCAAARGLRTLRPQPREHVLPEVKVGDQTQSHRRDAATGRLWSRSATDIQGRRNDLSCGPAAAPPSSPRLPVAFASAAAVPDGEAPEHRLLPDRRLNPSQPDKQTKLSGLSGPRTQTRQGLGLFGSSDGLMQAVIFKLTGRR